MDTFLITYDKTLPVFLRTQARLLRLGLRSYVIETPRQEDGKLGAALAHKLVTDFALAAGLNEVLIFEHDVVLRSDAMERFEEAKKEVGNDCTRISLGAMFLNPMACVERETEFTLKTCRTLHTHAYWLSRAGILWQARGIENWLDARMRGYSKCHDEYLTWIHNNSFDYCVKNIVAIQESGWSGVNKRVVDRATSYFRGFNPWKLEDFLSHCFEEDKPFVA